MLLRRDSAVWFELTEGRGQMLFVHPMWSSESERIGKQKCTPAGYKLHVFAELLGFVGLLLIAVLVVLAWKSWAGTFQTSHYWLLAAPFAVGIVSEVLFQCSWWLALRKGFRYDDEKCEASWTEAGELRAWKSEAGTRDDPNSR